MGWDGMGRHNLLWDGMGWDRKICSMDKHGNISRAGIDKNRHHCYSDYLVQLVLSDSRVELRQWIMYCKLFYRFYFLNFFLTDM